jgi:hypothetical protein
MEPSSPWQAFRWTGERGASPAATAPAAAGRARPPESGSKLPAVRLTLLDGTVVTSEQPDVAQVRWP